MTETEHNDHDERDRAWKYLAHADNLHSGRIYFFLVAESMLAVAFFTISPTLPTPRFFQICLAILGIVYTASWLYINARLSIRMGGLREKLKALDPIFKDYMEVVGGVSANAILSYLLPICTLLLWIILLIVAIICPSQMAVR